ncbi:hypothetical protein OAP78_06950 [Candidatus Pelagibacter sp.]|nr:hypothetical protein [Candidatus Pelagibacter sp.]
MNSRKFYNEYNLLEDAELKFYSQNGEDGIIDYIIQKLNLKKPNFVELGIGDYSESNTRFLYEKYYSNGLVVDIQKNLKKKVSSNVSLWRGNLNVLEKKISSENINEILSNNADFEIDVFSIDIDGIDYWILKEINSKISKLVIIEYNSIFGPDLEVTVPNNKDFDRTKEHYSNLYYGASLKAYVNLMKEKGYYFLGVNRLRNNAFFINNDFSKKFFFNKLKDMNLINSTDSNFSESRNKNGELNFLRNNQKIKEIENCQVLNLKNKENKLIKLKDLF